MTRTLVAGMLIAACAQAQAAGTAGTEALVSGVPHDALFAVNFDGANGIVAGAPGKIFDTHDGGKTWKADTSFPTPLAVLGADLKGDRAIAVGQMGLVFVRDGGNGWKKIDAGTTERLMNVSLNSKGVAVAVGSFGTVIKSEDGGQTWAAIPPDWKPYLTTDQVEQGIQPHMSAAHVGEDGVITIAGEFSLILRSSDGGKTWTAVNKGEPTVFALDLRGDGVGYAVGQDGLILRTADGGATWTKLAAASKANLLGVRSTGNTLVVTAMHDMIASTDSGQSWRHVQTPDVLAAWYSGVAVADGTLIAVGHTGRIIKINL
ncbi:MAG TPA: YCF48-related protein [Nevskiaceae bacterium]|nr:YCF48-related protein [Nevskiaceae bacterium]